MKISPHWLRDFVDLPVDYARLADELTLAGIAVEGISGSGENTVFEMEITTNRPDAMNHYGVAREASALQSAAQADRTEGAAFAGQVRGHHRHSGARVVSALHGARNSRRYHQALA